MITTDILCAFINNRDVIEPCHVNASDSQLAFTAPRANDYKIRCAFSFCKERIKSHVFSASLDFYSIN